MHGPGTAKVDQDGRQDGGYMNVSYAVDVPGEYAVHVFCDGDDIVRSPFMANIQTSESFDASKVCFSLQELLCNVM